MQRHKPPRAPKNHFEISVLKWSFSCVPVRHTAAAAPQYWSWNSRQPGTFHFRRTAQFPSITMTMEGIATPCFVHLKTITGAIPSVFVEIHCLPIFVYLFVYGLGWAGRLRSGPPITCHCLLMYHSKHIKKQWPKCVLPAKSCLYHSNKPEETIRNCLPFLSLLRTTQTERLSDTGAFEWETF